MANKYIIGDIVRGTRVWQDFSSSHRGVIVGTFEEYDDGETFYYCLVRFSLNGKEVEHDIGVDELEFADAADGLLPIFKTEFIAIGVGSAVVELRAEDMTAAEKIVSELAKGGLTSTGNHIPALMGCAFPPYDWKERLIVMYIKQEVR